MMQTGATRVHRSFWPADEFADFENGDSVATFNGRTFKKENFVRWAVTKGLDYQAKLGANPYQLGFIGGTDNHNGAPSDVVEDNYIRGRIAAKARSTAGSRPRSRTPGRCRGSGPRRTPVRPSGMAWPRARAS
jgi:hypothetical protein